jgi:hypothetical protein
MNLDLSNKRPIAGRVSGFSARYLYCNAPGTAWFFPTGVSTWVTAPSRVRSVSLFNATTIAAIKQKTAESHGCASGQVGPLHWK